MYFLCRARTDGWKPSFHGGLRAEEVGFDAVEVHVGGEDEAVGVEEVEEVGAFGAGGGGRLGRFEGGEVVEGFIY